MTRPAPSPARAPVRAPAIGRLSRRPLRLSRSHPSWWERFPIVTDQFATVTVLSAGEIQRSAGQNIGDVMFAKPGITSSTFAPGASRPIIRGQDNFRVRIQENGIATGDVSDIGEDHGVTTDPLVAGQIEVIRGPATLRWGSQAIGGVVNVDNNRIPSLDSAGRVEPRHERRRDHRRQGSRRCGAARCRQGQFRVPCRRLRPPRGGLPHPKLSRICSRPIPRRSSTARQPNSSLRTNGQSVGGSYLFDGGFVGIAVTRFASLYRIPGIESAETGTRIDLNQTKVTSKGEFRPQATAIDAIRFWLGASDYKHDELAFENGFDGVQQTFTNKSQEARAEVQLAPFNLRFAALTTALGVQASNVDLTAPGFEGGLFDPNRTTTAAAFIFNESQVQRIAQNAGRRPRRAGQCEGIVSRVVGRPSGRD